MALVLPCQDLIRGSSTSACAMWFLAVAPPLQFYLASFNLLAFVRDPLEEQWMTLNSDYFFFRLSALQRPGSSLSSARFLFWSPLADPAYIATGPLFSLPLVGLILLGPQNPPNSCARTWLGFLLSRVGSCCSLGHFFDGPKFLCPTAACATGRFFLSSLQAFATSRSQLGRG